MRYPDRDRTAPCKQDAIIPTSAAKLYYAKIDGHLQRGWSSDIDAVVVDMVEEFEDALQQLPDRRPFHPIGRIDQVDHQLANRRAVWATGKIDYRSLGPRVSASCPGPFAAAPSKPEIVTPRSRTPSGGGK